MSCRLTELKKYEDKFYLEERFINSQYVTDIEENSEFRKLLKEGKLPNGLNENLRFSNVYICKGGNCEKVVVVGSPQVISEKLNNKRNLLFG